MRIKKNRKIIFISFFIGFVVVGIIIFVTQNTHLFIRYNQLFGSDKNSHGCIATAGYEWCETKKKCVRSWEDSCEKLIGSDRDSHNCISSAGYQWCSIKNKCIRLFEEDCSTPLQYKSACKKNEIFCPLTGTCATLSASNCQAGSYKDSETISSVFMNKYNNTTDEYELKQLFNDGIYASGSVYNKKLNRGEGMYYVMKIDREWKIIASTRGSILCDDLTDYPTYPSALISECADGKGNVIKR